MCQRYVHKNIKINGEILKSEIQEKVFKTISDDIMFKRRKEF